MTIVPLQADFTGDGWLRHDLGGVLMANALHYVRDQQDFLERLVSTMPEPHCIIVEYDMDRGNPWVPFPLSRRAAGPLLAAVGLTTVIALGRRASVFRRAPIYGVLATGVRSH